MNLFSFETKTSPTTNSMNRSPLRRRVLLILFALACFALVPQARATCQEGCLTNGNTVLGEDVLLNMTGSYNTATGFNALYSNTTGFDNTANGSQGLFSNTTGYDNAAIGFQALYFNTIGSANTASGYQALFSNTTGYDNTANGALALYSNITGGFNTATGVSALVGNTIGGYNTATGALALQNNTAGNDNTATGTSALSNNTTGNGNTADGFAALVSNATGYDNTASGEGALYHNTTASNNTAVGFNALSNNNTGGSNIAVGESAGINLTTGSNNIDIGNKGVAGESNTIRIGKTGTQTTTVIAGIYGTTIAGGIGVLINSNGRLGTSTSSARFKENIQPMDKASEAILALKPVTFRYNKELDPEGISQFGLVAEEVEKINPDLVARDDDGKAYSVRYEAVNAMLLNEFLKAHRKIEEHERNAQEQETTVAELKSQVQALTAILMEQASQIQKVRAQLELNKSAPQTVLNDQ